ncbi:MAG: Serine hydrolase [Ilumatobacteraceae bacterium]|nr:Serine hydrolase [Ilumatobacteraceae bacterium]
MVASHLHDALAPHVDSGNVPGLVALVAEGDALHVEVLGAKALDDEAPMTRDSIFRIASLTKPIVAAAAMTMVDDGTWQLGDAIERWLPELAGQRVLRSIDAELDDTVPANRPISLEDVLTYRIGFGNVMAAPNAYPIMRAATDARLDTLGMPWPPSGLTGDQWIAAFGALPLMHQPGDEWMYNTSGQVLGVLVERVTGCALGDVLRDRLFEPLGMVDTSFELAAGGLSRLTTCYAPDPVTDELALFDPADQESMWNGPPAMANGAAGLLSTVDDLFGFARMIAAGGRSGAVRVLTEQSTESMTTDHLTAAQRASGELFLAGGGWGFGMRVPDAATRRRANDLADGYGWDGGTGTMWRTAAVGGRIGILLTQRCMTSPQPPAVFRDFIVAVDRTV